MADSPQNNSSQAPNASAQALPSAANQAGFFKKPWVRSVAGILLALILLAGAVTYKIISGRISIDTSVISAPSINIGPQTGGILQRVYVKPGDSVSAGETVAEVGTEVLTARIPGIVIATNDVPGQLFAAGSPVVTMIDPSALRVVATIDENKGLSDIHVGDPAAFTVDAFGSQTFTGVVDEISPTSNSTSIVFDISDKRPTNKFDVKILYDETAHPEFKNGMSAKVWVYPKR